MKYLLSFFAVLTILFANPATSKGGSSQFKNAIAPGKTIITYKKATDDKNVSKWTMKDYEQQELGKHPKGRIGNTQALFGNTQIGRASQTSDYNQVTRTNLLKNPKLKQIKSINAFNSQVRNDAISKAVSNDTIAINKSDEKLKCFITRNIPFRYKCSKTGVTFGGGMNESGVAALRDCINNCYIQSPCVNVSNGSNIVKNTTLKFYPKGSQYISSNNLIKLNPDIITSKISFSLSYKDKEHVAKNILENLSDNITIIATKADGTTYYLVQNLKIADATPGNLYIGERIKSIKIMMGSFTKQYYPKEIDLNFQINQERREQWICPRVQDISLLPQTKFSYLCPSGHTVKVGSGFHQYTICVDNNNFGDNANGTYSSKERCDSVCRITYSCIPDTTTMDTKILENFTEGCIQGQPNCTQKKCQLARLSGAKILNEKVFDASRKYRETIVNSIQIENADRPKILLRSDLSFIKRSEQEWKDGAYKNMITNGTYNRTTQTLGQDTDVEYAYGQGITSGVAYGVPGVAQRTIYLKLKPNAYSVDTNTNSYLYAMLKVDLEYFAYNINGKKIRKRNEIWYFKTSMGDTFVAKRFIKDYSVISLDTNGLPQISINEYATPQDLEFTAKEGNQEGSWMAISNSELAPYFSVKKFTADKIYHLYPIINTVGNLINTLPGIFHRRADYTTGSKKYYTGKRDGTAEAVVKYRIYTYMSPRKLTLKEFYDKVASGEAPMIYESLNPTATPNDLRGDGVSPENIIQIYTYGKIDKKSAFARIRPRRQDIGKKGFIFVFAQ